MSKATPGPWKVELPDSDIADAHINAGPFNFMGNAMTVQIARVNRHGDYTEANATLLAAAPELLAACETVVLMAEASELTDIAAVARAAIAKVTGETPCPNP